MEYLDINNKQIQLSIVLKLHELQRNDLDSLTYENIEDYLKLFVWKKGFPNSLHEAVNDILSVTADQVVKFLSKQAIIDGYYKPLSDFKDLL